MAAPSPTAEATAGVPASKRLGGEAKVLCSKVTCCTMLPPPCQGGSLLPQFVAAVDGADAAGAEQLVAGEHVEVAADGLHVDAAVRDALRAVDHHGGADALGHLRHFADGHDGAERVGDVGDGDDAGARPEQAFVFFEDEVAVVVHRGDADDGAGFLRGELPGHDVGVMLGFGQHDLVAGPSRLSLKMAASRLRPSVVPRTNTISSCEPAFRKAATLSRALLKGIAGHFRQGMGAAMDVGVLLLVVARHAVDHGLRLLRGGGAVEPDQRLAVHLALQDGEVAADGFDIEHGRLGRARDWRVGVLAHGIPPVEMWLSYSTAAAHAAKMR